MIVCMYGMVLAMAERFMPWRKLNDIETLHKPTNLYETGELKPRYILAMID